MKRFTLFLFAAVAAMCGFAQSVGEHGELIGKYGAIYQMPEGAPVKTYKLMGYKALYMEADEEQGFDGGLTNQEVVRDIEVVEFEDGTMFFKDLVSGTNFGSYVKGERCMAQDQSGDESEVVRIPVGQVIYHHIDKNSGYEADIIFVRTNFVDIEFEGQVFTDIQNCPDDLVFKVEHYGNCEVLNQLADQPWLNYYGAMFDDENGYFAAIGDAAVKMTYSPSEGENDKMLEMPAGVATKNYSCRAYSYQNSQIYNTDKYVTFDVQIARDGDDVYVKGLYYFQDPDAINPISNVLKGKYVDGDVIFPQHQLIGKDGRGANIYAIAMGTDETGYYFAAKDSWKLTYDEDTDTYDGGESIVRFSPYSFYLPVKDDDPLSAAYESIDEIVLTPKGDDGISTVERATTTSYYDLQGRQMKQAKGLVIVNKDGKMQKMLVK